MPIRTGLFRLSPDYTSCFALLTRDSPKSSHGQFRLVHLIWVCSFNSGYLLLFRPIYLFYIAVGETNNNQKTCPCLLLFSCSCINKQMIQSFTCIFKIVFKWGQHGRVLPRAAVKFVSRGSLWSEWVKRPANYTFLWRCNDDPIKQVTILSTVPRCEWKSWISDSVQQLVVVQMRMRCADVKLLWESEREKTRSSWITHVFSDDWFNLLVCVDLFTHLTYMLYSINICRNFPHYKLESCGNE